MPSILHETIVKYAEIKLSSKVDGTYVDDFCRKNFKTELIRNKIDDPDLIYCANFVPDSYIIGKNKIIIVEANITSVSTKSSKFNHYITFWRYLDAIYPEIELHLYFINKDLYLEEIDLAMLYYAGLTVDQHKKNKRMTRQERERQKRRDHE